MMTTDALVQKWFALPQYVTYIAEVTFAIGVVVVGKLIMKRRKAQAQLKEPVTETVADAGE
jgi:Flp pilus assembly protein protease CpaA